MDSFKALRPVARYFVGLIVLAGLSVASYSIYALHRDVVGIQWFVIAGLTVLTGSFTVRVPTIAAYLSVSETFVIVSAMMFGPAAGTVTVVVECLVIAFWSKPHRGSIHKLLFSTAAPALAI
jgi:hypothetical protein